MAEHRLDDGAVRHYQSASLPCGNLPQRRQSPFQQFGIALPFRRAGAQAVGGVRLVGMGPQRRDLFPAMAFPYAKTNLPQPLYRLGFYPQARAYDGRRLGRTFLRAGIEPPEGYAGLFQPAGQRPGLCPPVSFRPGSDCPWIWPRAFQSVSPWRAKRSFIPRSPPLPRTFPSSGPEDRPPGR